MRYVCYSNTNYLKKKKILKKIINGIVIETISDSSNYVTYATIREYLK